MAFGGGAGNGNGGSGSFNLPSFGRSDINAYGLGLPFTTEEAAAGLRGFLSNAGPYLQNIVGNIDEKTIQDAVRVTGETARKVLSSATTATPVPTSTPTPTPTTTATESSVQFKETVNVDTVGNKYGVDIVLGSDTKPNSLKISRKENVITIDVKTEKTAADGSSRLYQEYTRKITLPENLDLSKLETSLSPAGVLSIKAPFFPKQPEPVAASAQSTVIPVIIEDCRMD